MKIFKYLSLALVALFATSCEEHEIVFDAEPVASDRAFVQVFYMNPMTASSSNYVYKLHLDGVDYVNNYAAVMANYNGAPGGVARFYTVKSGDVSIKLYWGFWEDRIADPEGDGKDFDRVNGDLNGDEFYSDDYSKYVEKYSNTIRGLEAGKYYDVFIYDFEKDPIVIASGFPFESNVTEDSGDFYWVKFTNFMFEEPGQIYEGKVQYQYQYRDYLDGGGARSEWLNVGEPVAFGETTGWVELIVYKQYFNSSGYARADYRIVDEAGNVIKRMNAYGNMGNYSDYWTAYIGRRYQHIMHGFRNHSSSPINVTQWTGL